MSFIVQPQRYPPYTLIIGVGNEYCHDDGVGLVIAQALKRKSLNHVTIIESTGDGAELIDTWRHHEQVILIDAVASGAAPGTLHQINVGEHPLPTEFLSHSTHTFGVVEAIELARTLKCLPLYLLFFGIEGEDFTLGAGLSPSVEKAVPVVVNNVDKLIVSLLRCSQPDRRMRSRK